MLTNYRRSSKSCSAHYIREVVLFNLVLTHLQRVLAYVKEYDWLFVRMVNTKSAEEASEVYFSETPISRTAQQVNYGVGFAVPTGLRGFCIGCNFGGTILENVYIV